MTRQDHYFDKVLEREFGDRIKTDDELCKNIWSALANVSWKHPETGAEVRCTFRVAGGLIADMRGKGDYMDWYCSGPYATITPEIQSALAKAGWFPTLLE